ncbi:MAG: hypothetical protein EYC62_01150 [Alphaproteobacteria bacterium]|nr:MAG: hypothetical protein EYC62_01150 [Alphaproteobacteria bacterium]
MEKGGGNTVKIKITENSVTFKITGDELNHLLKGVALEKKVLIGQSNFVMAIDPNPQNSEDLGEGSFKLTLDITEQRLMLRTTMKEIQKLSNMGKSREGLSAHVAGLDVFLQVDVRKDNRPKQQWQL